MPFRESIRSSGLARGGGDPCAGSERVAQPMRSPIPLERLSFANCAQDAEAGHLSSAAAGRSRGPPPYPSRRERPRFRPPGVWIGEPRETQPGLHTRFLQIFSSFFCRNLAGVASYSGHRRISRTSPFAQTERLESRYCVL